MYTDHRPLYYRKETWLRYRPVDRDYYRPFFYRFNEAYSSRPKKVGIALIMITTEPCERITWVTFGGPLFLSNGSRCEFSHTETLPIGPVMEESRNRLSSILGSQMNV